MKAFVSVGMLIFITILFLSGLVIEIGEEVLGTVYEDETKVPPLFLFIVSFVTATHVLSGIFFAVLSIFHISKNWSALKNHLKTKSGKINKECASALILVVIVLISAFFAAFIEEL
ncbi:MAG: hypothetical protein LBD84_02490 [Campylobacteraceae bacterium]|jgi:hypothetical protein|nr:hypothetical protein [Campylobacteraceae bacterium]